MKRATWSEAMSLILNEGYKLCLDQGRQATLLNAHGQAELYLTWEAVNILQAVARKGTRRVRELCLVQKAEGRAQKAEGAGPAVAPQDQQMTMQYGNRKGDRHDGDGLRGDPGSSRGSGTVPPL